MQGARYLPTFAPPLRSRSDHAPLGGAANAVRLRSRYLVSKGFEELVLVPSKGPDPPHRCRYMDLNHARLPIPPRWQSEAQCSGGPKAAVSGRLTLLFYSPFPCCQTSASATAFELKEMIVSGLPPSYPSFAVIEIFAFNTFDTGHPFSAASAYFWKVAASAPGTFPTTSIWLA